MAKTRTAPSSRTSRSNDLPPADAQHPQAKLVFFWEGGDTTRALPLARGAGTGAPTVTVGRSPECDVRLSHPSISRKHFRLHLTPCLAIEDLESANGVRVFGTRLRPGEVRTIAPGDTITLGSVMALVQVGSAAYNPPSSPALLGRTLADEPPPTTSMVEFERLLFHVAKSRVDLVLACEKHVGEEDVAERIRVLSLRLGPMIALEADASPEEAARAVRAADRGTLFVREYDELVPETRSFLATWSATRDAVRSGRLEAEVPDARMLLVARGRTAPSLGIVLRIPPLRERPGEMLDSARTLAGRELTAAAEQALLAHSWPGNARELAEVVAAAVRRVDDRLGPLDADDLFPEAPPKSVVKARRPRTLPAKITSSSYREPPPESTRRKIADPKPPSIEAKKRRKTS